MFSFAKFPIEVPVTTRPGLLSRYPIIGALLVFSLPASAQTWTGTVSDDWSNGSNWSGGNVPGSSGAVTINTMTNSPVADGVTANLSSINIGRAPGTTGSLELKGGSQFTAATFSVGRGGTGTFAINDSVAVFTSSSGIVVGGEGGTGTLIVSGSTARLTAAATITLGGNTSGNPGNHGTLKVTGGAVVKAESFSVGNMNGGATVLVDGAGSEMISDYDMGAVGKLGDVDVTVQNGGKITLATDLYLGSAGTTRGDLILTGSGSRIDVGEDAVISYKGTAEATISDHAIMTADRLFLGVDTTGSSTLVVTSSASVAVAGQVTVGYASSDPAILIIASDATVSAPQVLVANAAGTSGSINIGGTATGLANAPGRLAATELGFGNGQGALNFNHTDLSGNYTFDAILSSATDQAQINHIAGVTRLTANSVAFQGQTNVSGGSLQVDGTLGGIMNVMTGGTLAGNGVVGDTVNAGTIAPGASIGTLTIAGNYTGNNGTLQIESVLGGDNSPTDKLIVNGNSSGQTGVIVTNLGGAGAPTVNGIQIIQVDGQSDGNFILARRAVAGAYEYKLFKDSNGNWYLSSRSEPPPSGSDPDSDSESASSFLRPEIGAYLGNQSAATSMFIHTLRDRLGAQIDGSNAWVRVLGNHTDSRAANGRIEMDTDTGLIHFGTDLARQGNWRVGLMGGYGNSRTKASARNNLTTGLGQRNNSKGTVDGYGLGLYATWLGQKDGIGAYFDTWVQSGRYHNKVSAHDVRSESYSSQSVTGSIEGGYAFQIARQGQRQWLLEPQAQLLYSDYDADQVRTDSGVRIDNNTSSGITSRLGARLSSRSTELGAILPFVEANWWHGRADNRVGFDGDTFKADTPKDRAELKAGLQGDIAKGWQVWGHVGGQWGDDGYHRYEGMVSIKHSF